MRKLLFIFALAVPAAAQIPSGFVQTTFTVASLANGSYGASWTNLSGSSQLPLLGGLSTFQTTVNGKIDSNGHASFLLADTSQVIPNPSTWTFSLTFSCPTTSPGAGGFTVQVAVTGGGGTEDISSQLSAALPTQPCNGGGGGGSPGGSPTNVQFNQSGNFGGSANLTWNNSTSTLAVGGSLSAQQVNGEYVASTSVDPATTIATACASSNRQVYFPQGIYQTSGSIALCSGLHLRAASSDIVGGSTGSVIQLKSGAGAVWVMLNPNSGAGSGNTGVQNVRVDGGLTIDISLDSSALGGVNMRGVGWSQFIGTTFHSNGNTGYPIYFDGSNFAVNNGDYNNDFFALNMYDSSSSASDIAIYMTDSSSSDSCSNENHFFGGSINDYGTAVKIDCGNNNMFSAIDMENFRVNAIYLTAQGSGGGAASGNTFTSPRIETSSSGVTGVKIDSLTGVKYNRVQWPYDPGATGTTDSSAANFCLGCLFPAATNQEFQTLFNNPSSNGLEAIGVNRTPSQVSSDLGAGNLGGIDVGGNENVTGSTKIGTTMTAAQGGQFGLSSGSFAGPIFTKYYSGASSSAIGSQFYSNAGTEQGYSYCDVNGCYRGDATSGGGNVFYYFYNAGSNLGSTRINQWGTNGYIELNRDTNSGTNGLRGWSGGASPTATWQISGAGAAQVASLSIFGGNTIIPAGSTLPYMGNPMTTLGDTTYGGASGAVTRLPGNTSGTTECLTSTGTGSAATAPVWGSCSGSASTAFSAITGSTNTTAAMVVGTGASLGTTGAGTISATTAVQVGTAAVATNSPFPILSVPATSGNQQPVTVVGFTVNPSSGSVNLPAIVTVGGNLDLINPAAATSGANQSSENLLLESNYWNGTASTAGGWNLQNVYGTGSNPTQTLTLTLPVGSTSGVSTVDFSAAAFKAASISSVAPAGDAGLFALVGNTVNQTCPTNDFCIFGFNSASATAYGWQPSTTAPSGTQVMLAGTPVSGASPVTYESLAGSGTGIVTGPTTSVSTDLVSYTGTGGQTQDSGILSTNVTQTTATPAANQICVYGSTAKTCTPTTTVPTAALAGTRKWTCQTGLGDGLNAIAAGTYLQTFCYNDTGSTVTITGLKCFTDNSGSSTMNASGHTLGALLTGAVTCTTSWAAGTQSANVALTSGDWIAFTFVADGTSKQTSWEVSGTY